MCRGGLAREGFGIRVRLFAGKPAPTASSFIRHPSPEWGVVLLDNEITANNPIAQAAFPCAGFQATLSLHFYSLKFSYALLCLDCA